MGDRGVGDSEEVASLVAVGLHINSKIRSIAVKQVSESGRPCSHQKFIGVITKEIES